MKWNASYLGLYAFCFAVGIILGINRRMRRLLTQRDEARAERDAMRKSTPLKCHNCGTEITRETGGVGIGIGVGGEGTKKTEFCLKSDCLAASLQEAKRQVAAIRARLGGDPNAQS